MVDITTVTSFPIANPPFLLLYILIPGFLLLLSLAKVFDIKFKYQFDNKNILGHLVHAFITGVLFYFLLAYVYPKDDPAYIYVLTNSNLKVNTIGNLSLVTSIFMSVAIWLLSIVDLNPNMLDKKIKKMRFFHKNKLIRLRRLIAGIISLMFVIIFLWSVSNFAIQLITIFPLNIITNFERNPLNLEVRSCINDSAYLNIYIINYYESPMMFNIYTGVDTTGILTGPIQNTYEIIEPHVIINKTINIKKTEYLILYTNYGTYVTPVTCGRLTR